MPIRLDHRQPDFGQRFSELLAMKREASAEVDAAARTIVDDVKMRGDAALIEATKTYDRLDVKSEGLRIADSEIDAAVKSCDKATLDALTFARDRIEV
ncbi:MAG: histidinol dehydrogenase, partial [Rhizobiales bacterium]|nr:histidinol dehydrogenase [Hyphomicrobiales bacterium]